jgi:hypothetical protein
MLAKQVMKQDGDDAGYWQGSTASKRGFGGGQLSRIRSAD